jgi:hypothetical protein
MTAPTPDTNELIDALGELAPLLELAAEKRALLESYTAEVERYRGHAAQVQADLDAVTSEIKNRSGRLRDALNREAPPGTLERP